MVDWWRMVVWFEILSVGEVDFFGFWVGFFSLVWDVLGSEVWVLLNVGEFVVMGNCVNCGDWLLKKSEKGWRMRCLWRIMLILIMCCCLGILSVVVLWLYWVLRIGSGCMWSFLKCLFLWFFCFREGVWWKWVWSLN